MIEVFITLLISLPQILIGKAISPYSTIIIGTKISPNKIKSPNNIVRLKKIRKGFVLSGVITLIGGIFCNVLNWGNYTIWFMLMPLTLSIVYTLIQLCKIEKNKNSCIVITILSIALIIGIPLIVLMPTLNPNEDIEIKNDTLFIGGSYSRTIPIADIAYIDSNASVPPIKIRTNGTSIGSYNVGHFRTKDNKDILLYLYSNSTTITHIQTKSAENLYINFKDSIMSQNFTLQLKERLCTDK